MGKNCNLCINTSTQIDHLRRHLKTPSRKKPFKTHSRDKLNNCNPCSPAFSPAGNSKIHQKNHNGEKPKKCNLCDSAFLQARHLKIHSRGATSMKCSLCCYTSFHARNLRTHLKIHSEEKSNKCNFLGRGNFMKYFKKHRGEKSNSVITHSLCRSFEDTQ